MDKLKQHKYWIALGAIGVVLVAVTVFFVFFPLKELSASQEELNTLIQKIENLRKSKFVPVQAYLDVLNEKAKNDNDAVRKGVEFYEAQGKLFHSFFEDTEAPPTPSDFSAKYFDGLDTIEKGYREKFGIKVDETNQELSFPKLERLPKDTLDEAKLPAAMKEFWIIQEVVKACEAQKVGGLRSVTFTGRASQEKDLPPYNRWVQSQVQIEMPYSKLENLITELYASPRVPFRIDDVSFHKTAESTGQFQGLENKKQMKDVGEANTTTHAGAVPEPSVIVDMRLAAFDWVGIPPEKESEQKEDEPPTKSTKDKKPPKK